jgi:hypothetical protein
MATVSSSVADGGGVVQAVHAGMNFSYAAYSSGGNKTPFSRSVSDAVAMMNLPRNARIAAAYLGGFCQDGNCGFSLGDPGSSTRHGTQSISATSQNIIWFTNLQPNFIYSVSDDQRSYPLTLNLQNTTSVSGSMSVHLGVFWIKA